MKRNFFSSIRIRFAGAGMQRESRALHDEARAEIDRMTAARINQ